MAIENYNANMNSATVRITEKHCNQLSLTGNKKKVKIKS